MYNPIINSVAFLLCALALAAIATGKVQAQSATGYHAFVSADRISAPE